MSRQFDEYIDGKIEFEGDYYALVEPTNLAELCEALRVKDIIQTAIDRTMPEDADYLYEKQEEQDGYINDYISSLGEFSNRILTSNIAFLTKKSGIRTGDLEKMLGISTGYISRTAKDNAGRRMSVDLAWKIARLFDISLYALLETDLSLPQDNNSFLTDFMQKLIYDTENAKAIWENRGGVCCYLDDYVLRTGLFDDNQSESSDRAMRYQPPRVSAGRYFDVSDDTFSFPITDDGRELLIVPYQFSETQKHFDFIFYWPVSDHHNIDGPTLWELAFTTIDNPMGHLADTAQALYNAIERLQFDAKITQDTKQVFSEYLKG